MNTAGIGMRVVVAASTALAPLASARAEAPSATTYLTPQSVAAVTVRLAEAVKTPLVESYPIEVLAAATDDFLGVKLDSIERVTLIVEPPMGVTPQYAVVLNSTAPISFDRFRAEITEQTVRGELDGHPLLEGQEAMAPSLCLLDDNTLAVGPKLFLKRLVRCVDSSSSDLAKAMLSKRGAQNHLQAAVMLGPLQPLIQMGTMAAKQDAPPEAQQFFDAIELVDHAVLAVDLSGVHESSLTAYANNGADADLLESALADGVALLHDKVFEDSEYHKLQTHKEPTARAMAAYMDRSFESQVAAFKPMREGANAFVLGRIAPGDQQQQLTSVAAMGILVALLLPAVQAAREAARRNSSMNNVKQIGLAMLNYESTEGHLPAQAICAADGTPLLSWRVAILPYLEEQALYEKFHLDEPWDSPHNKPLLTEMPAVFLDPSSTRSNGDSKADYLAVVGPNAVFNGSPQGRRFRELSDGASKTMMVVQVNDERAVDWTKPADYDVVAFEENPIAGIRSLHPGIFLAGYADGHISAVPLGTPAETLRALMTADGGEHVELP